MSTSFSNTFDSFLNAQRDRVSYLQSKGYIEMGDRTTWEPQYAEDLEDAFQDNDEPFLAFEEMTEF